MYRETFCWRFCEIVHRTTCTSPKKFYLTGNVSGQVFRNTRKSYQSMSGPGSSHYKFSLFSVPLRITRIHKFFIDMAIYFIFV